MSNPVKFSNLYAYLETKTDEELGYMLNELDQYKDSDVLVFESNPTTLIAARNYIFAIQLEMDRRVEDGLDHIFPKTPADVKDFTATIDGKLPEDTPYPAASGSYLDEFFDRVGENAIFSGQSEFLGARWKVSETTIALLMDKKKFWWTKDFIETYLVCKRFFMKRVVK
jgi:hypothetical protein